MLRFSIIASSLLGNCLNSANGYPFVECFVVYMPRFTLWRLVQEVRLPQIRLYAAETIVQCNEVMAQFRHDLFRIICYRSNVFSLILKEEQPIDDWIFRQMKQTNLPIPII